MLSNILLIWKNFNKTQNGDLVAISKIPTIPAGIFSSKNKDLKAISKGAKIAIPSDASNTARAYKLLEKAGWLKMDPNASVSKLTKMTLLKTLINLRLRKWIQPISLELWMTLITQS